MKALYVEPFAGISGNMLLGALLDAGVPFAFLQEEFAKLHLGNYELVHKSVNKCGIQAQYFNVVLPEEQEHEHAHDGDQVNEHHHVHDHDCDHEHEHHHDHAHDHAWMHAHGIAHSHDHEPVLEEKPCGCDHHHNHEHNHDQEHHHEHHTHHHHHEHRNLHDIEEMLDHSDLPKEVIVKAKEVFLVIAKAEAKVHGSTVEEIHFHEVGAIDTIIDVVGNILALQYLGIEKVFTTPVNTGFGFVECAHGQMPVPTPATAELLQGIPNYRGTVEKEMTTPTGAALLKVLASPVKEVPDGFSGETIGYGAGTRDVEIPNVLRVTMGLWNETVGNGNSGSAVERLLFLECNLDDLNPEIMPYVLEKLLAAGALDAWLQPVIMKKGRPAQTLKVLCSPEQRQVMEQIMFTQTTTLGVRAYYVERTALERRWKTVQTPWGEVRVKEGLLDGKVVNAVPEFEDCKKIAEANGVPLKAVETAALQE
ncbi:MAG: nickel pincer cofactor biosynthesis protein LarC [Acidaminococcaceae bacterium]|nr:nickel pincer cofactor biosynthesis protein LarC [Acidaminococcaceae bacterium]